MRIQLASALTLALSATAYGQDAPPTTPPDGGEAHQAPEPRSDLEEIVVTAPGHARSRFDVLQSTNVVTADELARQAAATLGDTLAEEPGIAATGFTTGASRPVIRGLDGPRVRVLENGVSTGDVSNVSPDHQVTTEPLLVQRIEVLRGAGTLRYGSSAIGGVVNVIDSSIPTELPEGPVDGELEGSYDINGDARTAAGAVNASVGGGFVIDVDGSYRRAGNVEIDGSSWTDEERAASGPALGSDAHGHIPNSSLRTWSAGAGGSRVFDDGYLGFHYTRNISRYGVPVSEEDEPIDIDLEQNRYDVGGGLERSFGPFSGIAGRFTHSDYEHAELEGETPGTIFTNDENELRVELNQRPWNELDGVVGFQWRGRDFATEGAEAIIPPGDWSQYGLFAVEEWHLEPVGFEAGLRIEQTRSDAEGQPERDFTTWSLSLGSSYTPRDWVLLGVTFSRTERPPAPEELYSNGAHFASFSFEVGNPSLDPEVAYGVELTSRLQGARGSAGLTFFYTHFDGFIFERDTGNVVDGLPERVFTGTDARFYGTELEGQLLLKEWSAVALTLRSSLDFTRAERANGDDLPRIPPFRLRGALELTSTHIDGDLGFDYAAKQDRIASFERETDSYFFVNAGAGWRPLEQLPGFTLRLDARNLFDAKGRNHVSFLKEFAPLPGRSLRLAALLSF
jgi:iron complex outermembrane receptor protein